MAGPEKPKWVKIMSIWWVTMALVGALVKWALPELAGPPLAVWAGLVLSVWPLPFG